MTKSHRAYFDAAKAVSKLSDFKKVQIGAVAVYGHRMISTGCNTVRGCPLQKKYNTYRFDEPSEHSGHAELMCLKPLIGRNDIDFTRLSLYVYREYKDGSLALSRPCKSCMALIKDLGIRKIYYTTHEGYAHEELIY